MPPDQSEVRFSDHSELIAQRNAVQAEFDRRVNSGGFAVALSGGGHRATLATLGALLALIDRGLGNRILQVASVSGGSITNAFVAARCELAATRPGELDGVATELATLIVQKGLLTGPWIVALTIVPLLLGMSVGLVSQVTLGLPGWASLVVGAASALTLLLARGRVVDRLLDRRYFRIAPSQAKGSPSRRIRLGCLPARQVDHVLCMTDLALGLPVYCSLKHGGFIWRRLEASASPLATGLEGQTFSAARLALSDAVRASAAFPGIPPRRLCIPPDARFDSLSDVPKVAFLADGGIWNNLGSQVLREDGFLGEFAAWERGVLRPWGVAPGSLPLLCFNGSANLRTSEGWTYHIPGLAFLRSVLQVGNVLGANTVLPRVSAMRRDFLRRCHSELRPNNRDPLDLIVDLEPVRTVSHHLGLGLRRWEYSAKMAWRERIAYNSDELKADSSNRSGRDLDLLPKSEPDGSYPGFADMQDWDDLRDSSAWKALVNRYGEDELTAPTTLGRIDKELARHLIARGYMNTYLTSLFLAPLNPTELELLAKLPNRLLGIVPP